MSANNSNGPLRKTATESAKKLFREIIESYVSTKTEEIDIDKGEEKITKEINEGSLTLQVIVIWLYYLPKNLSLEESLNKNTKAIDNLEGKVQTILPSVRSEVDRMTNYNNGLYKLFEGRLGGIKQDLDGLRDRDIKNLVSKGDFIELNSKVEKIPTLDDLTNEHSPLATKSKLSMIEKDIQFLRGKMSIQLWIIVGQILGIIITIGLVLTAWRNISLKINQGLSPSLNPPTQNVNPKPSP